MSEAKARHAVLLVLIATITEGLSCGLSKEKVSPSITILFPSENTSVQAGHTTEIVPRIESSWYIPG
ncbi:MAG: hypothetical protein A2Z14_18215 [Chloroflexi bacterium RBG_16_48_8]|nr:MAG: hypothetical protein A2Z14_18215 [Chloroflexi bacterium RBG_16_48_8]